MANERFAYSPIVTRPKLVWPDGKKLALYVVPNLEHYEYLPNPVRVRDPYPRSPHPDVLNYGARDYGNRVGFWRLLELFDRHRVRCTAAINIGCFEHYPEIQAACQARGWDYMCHGLYNTQYLWGLAEEEERAVIADCVASFARLTGRQLAGWELPGGGNTVNTPDLLAEAGIRYTTDWFHDDQPVPVRVKSGRLISLPYSIDVNDGRDFRSHIEAEEFAASVIDQFDRLLADGATNGRVMCLVLHPYIFGQPHRIGELDRILAHVMGRDEVWYATGSEIADWYAANYLPAFEAHLAEMARQ